MQYLTYIIKRFFLILLPFRRVKGSFISLVSGILILFGGILYAETETDNNSCISADIVLAPGIYTGTIGGESALGDYDYFEFNTPLNGTLTVELINNDNRVLNYSSLSTSCPSSTPNTLGNNATVRLTISSTSSGKYYLLLQGNKKNQATNYTINATFTPNVPTTGVDLKVTKVASVGETLIYNPFYYTVSVSNVGDQDATDINLTDTLPSGMRVDTVQTNDLAADWTCTGTIGTTLCTYDGGSLDAGDISIFKLYVQAPPSPGYITNEINVSSSQTDVDTTNNIDTETTYITNEVDTAEHICYYERTEINNPNYETACEKKGNFYYGNGCDASILIMEVNATDKLSQISIYKMYAPETKSGSCTYDSDTSANSTNGTQCSNLANTTEFGSYTEGYALTLNENNVSNIEVRMYDSDTYNTPRIDGIAMFGDYMTELGFHHTGRIYDCNGTSEGGVVVTSSADLIDTSIDVSNASTYNAHAADVEGSLKYIQTMVAGAPSREVNGVHLNLAGEAVAYETDTGIPYSIVPYMSDDTCSLTIDNIINPNTGQQLVLDVLPGTISAQNQMIVPTSVSKASRMQLIFVDPNSLSVEGQNCLANSSTTGNFARLAQCVNSEVQYKTAFGQDAWDRCGKDGGKPCLSQNNGSADPTDPSYDPATDSIYVNQLGCYMCTFNIQPSCTTDNFAIRPDRMQVGMTHPDAPDLLRAGKEYPLSLTARYPDDGIYTNGSAIPTDAVVTDYTVNDHNYNSDLESEEIRYFKNGQPDTEEILAGTS